MLMKDRIPGNTLSLVSSVCPSVCFVISFDLFMVTESNSKVFLSAVVLTETEARFISFSYSDGGYKRSFKKPRELVKNVSRLRFPHLFVNAGSCLTCFYAWDWLILKAVQILERNQAAHLRYRSDSVFFAKLSSSVWKGVRNSRKYKQSSLSKSPCYPSLLDTLLD